MCPPNCSLFTDVVSNSDHLQGYSGGKVNILRGSSVGHCEKKVHVNMFRILNEYEDRDF
jgi:hypothetical protein